MIFVALSLLLLKFILPEAQECTRSLSQTDFSEGTLRIKESGVYCLTEDITFEPDVFNSVSGDNQISSTNPNTIDGWPLNEEEFPGAGAMNNGPYALGYLAVIQIEASDVTLDLRGKKIEMSMKYFYQQRWGSIIQVGITPFEKVRETDPATAGPANFLSPGDGHSSVNNIIIKNGFLGRSSHHGILANNVITMKIFDLSVTQFEVTGIQINEFQDLEMRNIDIRDSVTDLKVNAQYSSARYILQAFLRNNLHNSERFVGTGLKTTRPGFKKTFKMVYEDLKTVMQLVYKYAMGTISDDEQESQLWKDNKDVFINEAQVPDGATVHGLLLHAHGAATGDIAISNGKSGVAKLENITVANIKTISKEIPILEWDLCSTGEPTGVLQLRGPFGDQMDVRRIFSKENRQKFDTGNWADVFNSASTKYEGNVLADAKIASAYFTETKSGNVLFAGDDGDWRTVEKNPFLNWVYNEEPLRNCATQWTCNKDVMGHSIKGIIGIRLEEIESVIMNKITVTGLESQSTLTSRNCVNLNSDDEGSISGDVKAISISAVDVNVDRMSDDGEKSENQNKISDLKSFYGDVTGIYINGNNVQSTLNIAQNSFNFDIDANSLISGLKLTQENVDSLIQQKLIPYPYNFFECSIHYRSVKQQQLNQNIAEKCTDRLADFKNTQSIVYPDEFTQSLGLSKLNNKISKLQNNQLKLSFLIQEVKKQLKENYNR